MSDDRSPAHNHDDQAGAGDRRAGGGDDRASRGDDQAGAGDERGARAGWFLIAVRYVLPAAVVVAGLIVMAFGSEVDLEGGASIVSAGLAIYAVNWLYRASVDGDRVREEEQAARSYYSRHGHWPDEAPAPTRAAATKATPRAASANATPGAAAHPAPSLAAGASPPPRAPGKRQLRPPPRRRRRPD